MVKMNIAALTALLSSVLLLSACNSVEETEKSTLQHPDELSKISVLAIDNRIQIKPEDTFSWHDKMAIVGVEKTEQDKVAAVLSADIEQGIQQQGHAFIKAGEGDATFNIAAMAILDKNGEESFSLVTHFGIDPGLGNSKMDHDKGALVLAVTDKDNTLLWRGVVQIFTAEDLSDEMRKNRRERAIGLLLRELFAKRVDASEPAKM